MKAVLVITDRDNVGTALETLQPGRTVHIAAADVTIQHEIPRGHKLAIRLIVAGEPVIKYGSAIGIATADIPAGAHVHTHNLASSRGRGDLSQPSLPPEGRLAEPPDEHSSVPDLQEARQRRRP